MQQQQQQLGQQSKAIIFFLILFAAHRDAANGVEQTQLNVQHAARTGTADIGAGAAPTDANAPGTTASVPTDAGMPYGNASASANETAEEPCPAPIPARQAPPPPLPSLPALPAFIALPPQPPQAVLRPAGIPLIGTQTTCRATGIAGRAHGARTASFGSAIWEELFGGGEAPPPPPKLFAVEPKCNSRVLESAILEVV
uniref:Uncharacterized protein n=1 Tax=Globodera rostochiensis TaxID=31243 RepID=A0A914IDW3_GLORO